MAVERLIPNDPSWPYLSPDHLARYLFAAEYVRDKHVLDAGTGLGYGAAILKASGARSVTALDIDASVIDEAKKRFSALEISFRVGNSEALQCETEPDVICNFENIEHLTDPLAFVRNAARVLRNDGVLLCSTPDRAVTAPFVNGRPANPYHINEWYEDEFVRLLRNGFAQIDMKKQIRTFASQEREKAFLEVSRRLTLLERGYLKAGLSGARSFVRRLLGRDWPLTFEIPQIRGMAVSTLYDFPVLSSGIADLFGSPKCHFAVCRGPVGA